MEIIRPGGQEEDVLVNPNPTRQWECCVRGKQYYFKPMRKYLVARELVNDLMQKAQQSISDAAMQSQSERSEAGRLTKENRPAKAAEFLDANGEPKTKPWARPPLVMLSRPDGQKFYLDAIKEAKKLGIQFEESEDLTMPKAPIGVKEIVKPKAKWEKPELMKWLEGQKVRHSAVETREVLYAKATGTYENLVSTLSSVGVRVVDPEDSPTAEQVKEAVGEGDMVSQV